MSKLTLHKRSRGRQRRRPNSSSAMDVVHAWGQQLFAQRSRSTGIFPLPKLLVAFCAPILLLTVVGLLTGPLATSAIAQDAAANVPKADTGDTAFMLICSALVLLMTPGLAFFYGGLVRSRNVLNMMMMSFVSMAVVGVTWVLWGYSLSFAHVALDAKNFDQGIGAFIGSLSWIGLNGVGLDPDPIYAATIPHQVFMIYQMMFAIITVALISGAIAERMTFKAYFWFLVLWSTFIYCPMAHMVWGRGLLQQWGALDFAGGTVVHISSGVSALVAAWLLGPRRDYGVKPIIPHNVPFVLLGVGLLWFGWFGFNAGSAIGVGVDYKALPSASVAFVATTISASAAGLAWMLGEWLLKGKATAVGLGSGFVAGLVGITPAAGFVTPTSAILIGVITGLCCLGAVHLKAKLQFDDALDTFPVHGVGGTIGALLTGIFTTKAVNGLGVDASINQLGIQAGAVLFAYVFAAIGTLIILKILGLFMELRASQMVEAEGLDIHEHGEGAYGEELAGEISFAKPVR